VDARHRDIAPDAVHQQRTGHEQQTLPQLGELAQACAQATHGASATRHQASSMLPPAASIAARAPAVASTPLSTSFFVTSPFFTILARLAVAGTSFAA